MSNNNLVFKNKPIVRSGSILYYGNPSEKFIVRLNILETSDVEGFELSTKVSIELLDISSEKERLIKKADRSGLYDALEIGSIWLDRSIAEYNKYNK